MARTRTATAATGAPLGVFHGRINKVEDGLESQFDNKMQIKLVVEILDVVTITDPDFDDEDEEAIDELIGSEEWAWANDTWTPNSKAMRWACGILGVAEIPNGQDIDIDEWEGREVQFTKGINQAGNPAILDFSPWRPKRSKNGRKKPKRRRDPEPEYEEDEGEDDEDLEDF